MLETRALPKDFSVPEDAIFVAETPRATCIFHDHVIQRDLYVIVRKPRHDGVLEDRLLGPIEVALDGKKRLVDVEYHNIAVVHGLGDLPGVLEHHETPNTCPFRFGGEIGEFL